MADAEEVLRKLLNEKFVELKEEDVTIKAISSGGANYTSDLYIVDLKHQGENLHLFAKVAIIGDKMRAAMNADWMYKTEEIVYTQLMKIFNDLQEKHVVPVEYRFMFPKFYGCNTENGQETVVLENLNVRGFKSIDRLKSLNWDHAAVAVSVLARFHALSFAYEKEYPEEFKIIAEKMKSKTVTVDDKSANDGMIKLISGAVQLLKEEYRGKMANFMGQAFTPEEYMKFRTPISRTVLAHGDYRTSNLLFRRHNGVVETIVVDFQTVHSGSPVSDLLYLIFLGTDEQFRRYYYKQLLEHYYQELSLASSRLKVDISEVYPRETFESELKEMLPHALRMSVPLLSIVTVDAEKAAQVKGDAGAEGLIANQNALFAERFNGVVSDCARWGVI